MEQDIYAASMVKNAVPSPIQRRPSHRLISDLLFLTRGRSVERNSHNQIEKRERYETAASAAADVSEYWKPYATPWEVCMPWGILLADDRTGLRAGERTALLRMRGYCWTVQLGSNYSPRFNPQPKIGASHPTKSNFHTMLVASKGTAFSRLYYCI